MGRWMTQDRWAAVACMAIAAFIIAAIPYQTSDRPIPGARGFDLLDGAFFPKIAVTLFLVAAVWLFVEGRPKAPAGQGAPGAAGNEAGSEGDGSTWVAAMEDEPPGLTLRDFLFATGLTVGVLFYVQLLGWFGYLASTIAAVIVLSLICGQRSWFGMLLGAVVFPVVVYFLFTELFRVPLPRMELW